MADNTDSQTAPPIGPAGGTSPDETYLERRTLRRGSAGPLLLTGLGVAYVVSGDFSGWNNGLAQGGFGGLAIAAVLMGLMYTCLVFALAELASILPTAGGGYGFARRALGTWGGFLTGTAILIEYVLAPAAISIFIGDYVESLGLFGLHSSWPVYLACFVIFIGIHLWGVGEALRFSLIVTAIAVAAVIVFAIAALTDFHVDTLNDIPVKAGAFGANSWLPFGILGIWASFPFGMWFFLGVEGVPLAAEETKDPVRSLPKAMAAAMGILLVLALITFVAATGARGSAAIQSVGDPLVQALQPARQADHRQPDRQLRGSRGPGGVLLLPDLRRFAPAVRALPGRLSAPLPLPDQPPQGSLPGAAGARRAGLRARRGHRRRRPDAQCRGLRRHHLLRADGALAHRAAPP